MNLTRIVIVDDHPLFRQGLKGLLTSFRDFRTVALVDDFAALKNICEQEPVDLILMDADLGEICGAETTRKIKLLFPEVKILALSAHDEKEYIRNMLEAGAAGYLLKATEIEELSEAIRMVANGNTYFSSAVSKLLLQAGSDARSADDIAEKLTLRELEILKFVIQDELSNKEIANHLFISPRTVETHKRNLIQKLQVKNTIGLAKYYFQYSLGSS